MEQKPMITVIYLYIAVLAQSGEAHRTIGVPQPTTAACLELKKKVDVQLEAETHVADPDNAKAYVTVCVPMILKTPSV
jgi:hypothetical protein